MEFDQAASRLIRAAVFHLARKSWSTKMKSYSTAELAEKFNVAVSTPISSHSKNGHYFGLVPRKLPNGRLAWAAAEVDKLLIGATK